MSGIDPCGELALDILCDLLDSVSTRELPTERGDSGAERPRFFSLTFPLSPRARTPLTSPSVSTVIIFCSAASFLVSASSSSAFRSASSSLIASSSSDSLSELRGVAALTGPSAYGGFFPAWSVSVDEEVGFFTWRELLFALPLLFPPTPWPSEFRRARTPPTLELERWRLPPPLPSIPRRPATPTGLSPLTPAPAPTGNSWCGDVAAADPDVVALWADEGLSAPWISRSPRISSWKRALTR